MENSQPTYEFIDEFKAAPELKDRLREISIIKQYRPGDVIVEENSSIVTIPIVSKGSVKVMQSDEEGREMVLYYLKPGEGCIMSFLGGIHDETSKIRVVSEDNTELMLIPVDKMSGLMQEYPAWLNYIFRLYHKRFEELLEVINAVSFKKMDERLLDYLRKKAGLTGSKVIYITHEQIGSELGTARVVVSRLLKQMEKEGMVELSRNKVILKEW